MSGTEIDGVMYEVVPHVCNHSTQEPHLIEWCVCPIGRDHPWDDMRIEPHECAHPREPFAPGWWQNPVTQTMTETPIVLAARIAANPDAASDSDKLRSIADWIDLQDAKAGRTGTEAQDFLRDLATRLEME